MLLLGGKVTDAWGHLLGTATVVGSFVVSLLMFVTLMGREPVNPQALAYLNRLSDLLFVLARVYNDGGAADVLWRPGQSQAGGP